MNSKAARGSSLTNSIINKQQTKTKTYNRWPTSPSAHLSVMGDSPLYSGGLHAASGGSSPT
jgi:hypothetical protein